MKEWTIWVSFLAVTCFLCSVSFTVTQLTTLGVWELVDFLTYTDYVNSSIPIAIVLLIVLVILALVGIPLQALFLVTQKNKSSNDEPSGKRKIRIGRVVRSVAAALVVAYILSDVYLSDRGVFFYLAVCTAIGVTAFIVARISQRYFPTTLIGAAFAIVVLFLSSSMVSFITCHSTGLKGIYTVTTTTGTNAHVNIWAAELGLATIRQGNFDFTPWDHVLRIERDDAGQKVVVPIRWASPTFDLISDGVHNLLLRQNISKSK